MKRKVLMAIATITTIFASLVATSACLFCIYQPEEPECLREE